MRPGDVVAGRFRIDARVGAGGMGTVWRALDHHTGLPVAVKTLNLHTPELMARFRREADALRALDHPAIARYVAHGPAESGFFVAMEWLDGEDLGARLKRAALGDEDAIEVLIRAAEALGHAHARGIIHRDVKPSNLFLVGGDAHATKLIDFGIARWIDRTRMTATGGMIGTPGWVSPEQAKGESIGAPADVFSLGCVAYRCFTGAGPFEAEDAMATLAKLVLSEPVPIAERRPDAPRELAALVMEMLSKDPQARPRDGAAVAARARSLRGLAFGSPPSVGDEHPTIARATQPRARLGEEERGLVAAVLADAGREAAPDEAIDRIREAAALLGARVEVLDGGLVVASLSDTGHAADASLLAARCAFAIRSALGSARIAVVTKRVPSARRRSLAEAIDSAARLLLASSEPATTAGVLVDSVTAALLSSRFDVRGDRLFGERAATDLRPGGTGASPFLGRERELAWLDAAFDECVAERSPRTVLVTGSAGMGKSRLVSEALASMRARSPTLRVWSGAGDPIASGSPLSAVSRALRGAAGVVDGEPLSARRERLHALFAGVVESDAANAAAVVGEVVGVPFDEGLHPTLLASRRDPSILWDRIVDAMVALVRGQCALAPTALVLDDLHWADTATLRLVRDLVRRTPSSPLLVVGLARPEVHDRFRSLVGSALSQQLHLGGISTRASEAVAAAIAGGRLSAERVSEIVGRADGNAFYLEELARAASSGVDGSSPDSVLAVVESRLVALDPALRKVLRAASVFGNVFWSSGVAELTGSPLGAVEPAIAELEELGIVERRGGTRFDRQTELAFHHALLRDAAYAMLDDADRALGHRLAASWLETAGEADALVIARHHELGGRPDLAVDGYRVAAERALAANELTLAIDYAQRGIALGANGRARAELFASAATARVWTGELTEVIRLLDEVQAAADPADPMYVRCLGARVFASARVAGADVDALVAAIEACPGPVTADHAFAWFQAAWWLLGMGRSDEAGRFLARLEGLLGVAVDPLSRAWAHFALTYRAVFVTGDAASMLDHAERARIAFADSGDFRFENFARAHVGWARLHAGSPTAAAILEDAHARACAARVPLDVPHCTRLLALERSRRGAHAEAKTLAQASVDGFCLFGDRRMQGVARETLAEVQLAAGDAADAEREARAAVELLAPSVVFRAVALARHAAALEALGRGDEAVERALSARDLLAGAGTMGLFTGTIESVASQVLRERYARPRG